MAEANHIIRISMAIGAAFVLAAAAVVLVVAARPAQAAFPGTNGKIAFSSNRDGNPEIYMMNSDGTGQTRLTTSAGTDDTPAFSSDGTRIAFTSTRSGSAVVYVMNALASKDVTKVNEVALAPGSNPTFSPDGFKVAFEKNADILVMNADGSGTPTNLTNMFGDENSPSWSPDGSKIAFDLESGPDRKIFVMNSDGGSPTQVTDSNPNDLNGDQNPGWQSRPSFSPDGSKIAFFDDPTETSGS